MKQLLLLLFLAGTILPLQTRSPLREQIQDVYVTTRWANGGKTHKLKSPYLRYDPIFRTYQNTYFFKHLLPLQPISYRYAKENRSIVQP